MRWILKSTVLHFTKNMWTCFKHHFTYHGNTPPVSLGPGTKPPGFVSLKMSWLSFQRFAKRNITTMTPRLAGIVIFLWGWDNFLGISCDNSHHYKTWQSSPLLRFFTIFVSSLGGNIAMDHHRAELYLTWGICIIYCEAGSFGHFRWWFCEKKFNQAGPESTFFLGDPHICPMAVRWLTSYT